jgi:hypothetical protein
MTTRNLLRITICTICVLFLSGCFSASRNAPKIKKPDDEPPFITNVQSCRIIANQFIASSSLTIGEKSTLRITAIDPNLDIKNLFIRGYFPRESETPAIEYGPITVEPQKKKRTSFYLKDPLVFEGEPGDWLFEVQIEDDSNNLSNKYRFHIILH